ncbi:MAG: hypothetical protein IPN82_04875 [Chitinophagaceae bacterium]|nr:hypothetical protein [Chitinophagaceae bacterium]
MLSDNITSTGFTNSFGVYGRRGPVPAVNAAPTAATTAFFVKQDGNALAGYSQTGIGTFGITNTGGITRFRINCSRIRITDIWPSTDNWTGSRS